MSERPVIVLSMGSLMVCDLVPLLQLLFSFVMLEHWFSVQLRAEEVFCWLIDDPFGVSCSHFYSFAYNNSGQKYVDIFLCSLCLGLQYFFMLYLILPAIIIF